MIIYIQMYRYCWRVRKVKLAISDDGPHSMQHLPRLKVTWLLISILRALKYRPFKIKPNLFLPLKNIKNIWEIMESNLEARNEAGLVFTFSPTFLWCCKQFSWHHANNWLNFRHLQQVICFCIIVTNIAEQVTEVNFRTNSQPIILFDKFVSKGAMV